MNENYFTLRPHVIKLCRLEYIIYWTEAIKTRMFQIYETFQITSTASYSDKILFINIPVGS